MSGYLEQIAEHEFELESVDSYDDWETARVVISGGEQNIKFQLNDVNDSDWVPPSLSDKMYEFSKKYCDKILHTLHGEDPFIVLYLTEESISDLDTIRSRVPEAQYNR